MSSRFADRDTFHWSTWSSSCNTKPSPFQPKYKSLKDEILNEPLLNKAWQEAAKKSNVDDDIVKFAYTFNNGFYGALNEQLRSAYNNQVDSSGFSYYHYFQLMNKQIKKTGPIKLYRGEPTSYTDFGGVGKKVDADQYESCSMNKEVAEQFLSVGGGKRGTLFIITTNVVIEILEKSFYPMEKEYIVPFGYTFTVTAVRHMNGYLEIELVVS